jgi:hypothetical protein
LCHVDFADDRVVANILLDGEFKIDAHATFSIARNRALRALGFLATSSSPGTIGRLVTSRTTPSAASGGSCA